MNFLRLKSVGTVCLMVALSPLMLSAQSVEKEPYLSSNYTNNFQDTVRVSTWGWEDKLSFRIINVYAQYYFNQGNNTVVALIVDTLLRRGERLCTPKSSCAEIADCQKIADFGLKVAREKYEEAVNKLKESLEDAKELTAKTGLPALNDYEYAKVSEEAETVNSFEFISRVLSSYQLERKCR